MPYDPLAKNTKIHHGDQIVTCISQRTAMLIDKNKQPRRHYLLDNASRFILKRCPLHEYASNAKDSKLLGLIVGLMEQNNGKKLNCTNLLEELNQHPISIPIEYHCMNCPHWMPPPTQPDTNKTNPKKISK